MDDNAELTACDALFLLNLLTLLCQRGVVPVIYITVLT